MRIMRIARHNVCSRTGRYLYETAKMIGNESEANAAPQRFKLLDHHLRYDGLDCIDKIGIEIELSYLTVGNIRIMP